MPDSARRPNADAGFPVAWPAEGLTRIPDWVYTSPEIYEREVERIFHGPSWNFVALEAELPAPGCSRRSFVGPAPVVVARDAAGAIHVFENRCAHRGAELCRPQGGKATELICPYHQWTYDLAGNLTAVPFRRGLQNQGGMPKDFRLEEHGLKQLTVATRGGVVFASFDANMPNLGEYLGPEVIPDFDPTLYGRTLHTIAYY